MRRAPALMAALVLAALATGPAGAEPHRRPPAGKAPGKPPAPPLTGPQEGDPATATRHTVKPGETLGGIALRARVPRVLIIEANGLAAPYGVRAGQVLVIPRRRDHVTRAGETGFAIAMDYGVPWSAIAAANGLKPDARVRAGQKLVIPTLTKAPFPPAATGPDRDDDADEAAPPQSASPQSAPLRFVWPAPGKVRRSFAARAKGAGSRETGRGSPHDGIDIAGQRGDPVRAAAPGLVWYAGKEPNLYGNVVILDHGQGWFSAYAKLAKVTVRKGETVRAGERVGLIGNTGSTPTTELHFEIRRKTVPVDPLKVLPRRD